jgi:autotransporter-associated beta strand protein
LNGGDLHATGDVTLGGEDKRDFGYYNADNNGTVEANGIYKNVTSVGLIYQYITNMVVGAGGYGMYRKDYSIQFCKDLRLTAKADLSIHKPIAEDGPKNGDWGLFLNDKTFTIDTAGYKVIFDSYVGNGANATSGAIVKEGEGELVMASLEKRYSGATTVKGGTLKVLQPVKGLGTGEVTIKEGGTLALVPDVTLSNSSVSIENGGAFACVESGVVVLGSDLNLADGAKLKFAFSKRNVAPVLDVAGKTVTLGENKAVTIAFDGAKRPCAGRHVLTSGEQFADAVVSLDENHPKWVLGVGVNDEGNIYADIKPIGTRIIVR